MRAAARRAFRAGIGAALIGAAPGLAAAAPPQGVSFSDVTASAGIRFRHVSGAFGKKYLPETMGSGCAFLDYDNDGWQDVLLVNGRSWPGRPASRSVTTLYRNNKNGTFSDVSRAAGLAVEQYGMGVAVADYDNDGWPDVYLTGVGAARLFRNRAGRFEDVTAPAGVGLGGFSTSAAFFDYDKDGRLDLFVARYVDWSIDKDLFCSLDGRSKSYCTPESYKGQSPRLFRNRGQGVFEDATARAGLEDPTSKALGVALLDYDGDGWLDLFVANDTQPNRLYRNTGRGAFVDVGVSAGVAFGEAGVARAGMGVDAADYDGSGRPSLIVGNFSSEMMALYHNEGSGLFIDEAPATTVGQATFLKLTFGCFFFDYDLDGRLDILGANGHVADDVARVHPQIAYAQPPHLFRNLGERRFQDVSRDVGSAFVTPLVARGAAYGDYDNDGDLDLLLSANNGPARLLRNDGGNRNAFLRLRLVGERSNRDAIGARVTVTHADASRQWAVVKTGSSYCSQSELPLTFGLGPDARVARLEIAWPSGAKDTLEWPPLRRILTVAEGRGLVAGPRTAVRRSPSASNPPAGPRPPGP